MSTLQIYLFGNFKVLVNNRLISSPLWQSRQLRTILKYLIVNRGVPVSTSQIVDIVWPDKDPVKAVQHTYVRISQLRKILNSNLSTQLITRVDGGYLFNPPSKVNDSKEDLQYWIDVDEFEKNIERGNNYLEKKDYPSVIHAFEKAVQLYQTDYLVEDIYEDWTISERERLKDLYLVTLTELAETFAQTGRFRRAISTSNKILSIDSCRESAYYQTMLFYYYLGEKNKALDVYQQCQKVLQKELNVQPDFHTNELAKRISTGKVSYSGKNIEPYPIYSGRLFDVPISLSEMPFTGRDLEISWMIQQWKENPTALLWVKGEAGIGKTRLVQEFTSRISQSDAIVLKILACEKNNSPFQIWMDAIKTISNTYIDPELYDEIEKIQSILSSPDTNEVNNSQNLKDDDQKYSVARLLIDFFTHPAMQNIVIWVDDAHLIDAQSRLVLSSLIGTIPLIFSSRLEDNYFNQFMESLIKEKTCIRTLELKGWDQSTISKLLENLGTNHPNPLASRLYTYTNGNLLFLLISLQYFFEEGFLYVNDSGHWEQTSKTFPEISPNLVEMVNSRINQIPLSEQRILDVICVAGGEIDYDSLAKILDLNDSQLLDHVDKLLERGILSEPRSYESNTIRFSHQLFSEVIYQNMPKTRKKTLHQKIGSAFEPEMRNNPAFASILAYHFSKGNLISKAIKYEKLAGDHAMHLYTPNQAKFHYQNALDWLQDISGPRENGLIPHLQFSLAEALRLSGNYTSAIELYHKAAPKLSSEFKQIAYYQIFQLQVLKGNRLTEFKEISTSIEKSLLKEGDSWALALFYWSESFVNLLLGNKRGTIFSNAKGWRVARSMNQQGKKHPTWICNRALSLLMRAHNQWGNYQTSIHFAQRNSRLLPSPTADTNIKAVIKSSLGESFYHLGNYQKAKDYYLRCRRLAEDAGDLRLVGESKIGIARISFEQGEFQTSLELAQEILMSEKIQDDILRYLQASFLIAKISIVQPKVPTEKQKIEKIVAIARFQVAIPYIVQALIVLSQLNLAMNEFDQAVKHARESSQLAKSSGLKREQCEALRCFGLAAFNLGQHQEANHLLKQALEIAKQIQSPFEIGKCLQAFAKVSQDLNFGNEALNTFERMGASHEARQTKNLL